MARKAFKATLETEGPGFFIRLPFDVKKIFGKARPAVKVSLDGYTYRSTVAVYGGESLVPVRRAHREAAGVEAGARVAVVIESDDAPRVVEVPADLAAALKKSRPAKKAWDALSYTHQREHVEALEGAKKADTRARRLDKTIAMLLAATTR
jgi:hypothetical protein